MPTYRLDIAYDGSEFHGFARQRGLRTIQGEVEGALKRIFGVAVETVGAGRTDAGVHARGQVMSFSTERDREPSRVYRGVTSMLGPGIVASGCSYAASGFSARFDAKWREYRYVVLNSPVADPLLSRTTWHVADPLDIDLMNQGVPALLGEHDFASFCRSVPGRSTGRRILEAEWTRADRTVEFRIRASAFCHQMVRSLTGFFVDVGRGRVSPEALGGVIEARDRSRSRPMAPPQGLILWEVGYE